MLTFLTRNTVIARYTIAKQKTKLPLYLPFRDTKSDLVKECIHRSLSNPLCGVHILYHPSTILLRSIYLDCLNNLRNEMRITGALIATSRNSEIMNYTNLTKWFKNQINISEAEKSGHISDLLEPGDRVAIVIDGIDNAENHPGVESFICGLAEDSLRTKRYTVLLCMNNTKFYKHALTFNGGAKIYPVYKWD